MSKNRDKIKFIVYTTKDEAGLTDEIDYSMDALSISDYVIIPIF